MRPSLLFLSAFTAAVVVAACNDRPMLTDERSGPMYGAQGNRDTTGLPSHYTANGATAEVSWYGWSGDSAGGGTSLYGYVYASRVGSITNEWTQVNWYVSACDALGCRYTNGYGYAPGAALSGQNTGHLRLAFDPADSSGYFDVWGDPLGPVDITWSESGAYTTRTTGTTEYDYPGYRYRSNGVTRSASATATGHAGAYVLPPGAGGSVGTNHAVTITFYR